MIKCWPPLPYWFLFGREMSAGMKRGGLVPHPGYRCPLCGLSVPAGIAHCRCRRRR